MPRRTTHLIRWLPEKQRYSITADSRALSPEIIPGSHAWTQWLETISSFAFQSRSGEHCTVRKERLQRGDVYWYGYRSIHGRTKKRYLGRTADLSLERLEEICALFTAEEKVTPWSAFTQQQILPTETVGNSELAPVLAPFLETKLHPPRLPSRLVERSRLLSLLDAGQPHKLTLLQAPAGFGKTTLINQWIAHLQARGPDSSAARQELSSAMPSPGVAWISLDGGDNDPVRFWSSIITACQAFQAQIGQTALKHLSQATQLPFASSPLETILTFLINDLTRSVQEGLLILEDYHFIEHSRIHETMAFFIEHLPTSLHVVIMTRSEPPLPLVRWRARGDLLEVQSMQLRFSAEETATFLQQVLPHSLSTEAVRSLHTHLEGWAAGLRLLALGLQGQMTQQALEEALAQLNTGFIANRTHRPIQEYFMSEVFVAQAEPFQLFLLQTSILSRLTGSLCDAVTGREDSAQWLEIAERSGFFLEALDSAGQWYRYHALFAEAMKAEAARRLGDAALRHLSAKASRWFEEHSMRVEAIEAALSAHESERAAYLIGVLNRNAYFSEQHTLLRWLEQLPETLLHAHPTLCFFYAQAIYATQDGDLSQSHVEEIEGLLQIAEEGWHKQGDMPHLGLLYALRTTMALLQGHHASAVALARMALQFSPVEVEQSGDHIPGHSAEWIDWRCGSLSALGLDAIKEGRFDRAHQHFLEALTLSLNNTDRVFTRILKRLLGEVCTEAGELHQAAEYLQQIFTEVRESEETGDDIIHTFAACALARLFYEWNDLEKAEQLACEAINYRYSGTFPHWEEETRTNGEVVRLLVLHVHGDVATVQQQLSALLARLQASSFPNIGDLIQNVLTWQARLQIVDGDLSAARRTLSQLTDYEKEMSPLQLQTMQLVRARLFLARGDTVEALHLLERLLITALVGKHIFRALEIQLLIALTYAADKQGSKARQRLSEVLSQARNEGFMRLFLDEGEPLAALLRSLLPSLTEKPLRTYAESILHAFNSRNPHISNGGEGALIEPLSVQERRVLALLVAGRSNPEIAEDLIISVNTVKGHVRNLYRKLNVANRVQAGDVARRLKLI